MGQLILLRHGASAWNEKNIFTGWVDIPLSSKGIEESLKAGLFFAHTPIQAIYVSTLIRAQMSALLAVSVHTGTTTPCMLHPQEAPFQEWTQICNEQTQKECIPIVAAWQLNERMYGDLQGMNKDEARRLFGKEQVELWRRSFDEAPPGGESLKMTAERAVPYFHTQILPRLNQGENILVVAHGNSLRAIVMDLEHLSKEQVLQLEISTGAIRQYDYDKGVLRLHAR